MVVTAAPRATACRLATVMLMIASVLIASCAREAISSSNERCGFLYDLVSRSSPSARWEVARPGLRLQANDAILSCDSGSATLRSSVSFSRVVDWKPKQHFYLGLLEPVTLLVVRPDPGELLPPNVRVEVIEVRGTVLYSQDRALIRSPEFPLSTKRATSLEMDRYGRMREALTRLTWRPLHVGDELEAWQLIWTGTSGRVEIEISREGSEHLSVADTDVVGSDGRVTRKKRFLEETFFVMYPRFFLRATVNAVIGDVFVAGSTDEVRRFVDQYGELMHSWRREDAAASARRREMLKKPELE